MDATSFKTPTAAKACHNCRRRRLRCDRSFPHCKKCLGAGKECLGYGKLFRWIGAVASRGKLAGRTSSAPDVADASGLSACPVSGDGHGQLVACQPPPSAAPCVLVDPVFQNFSLPERRYLVYYAQRLSCELVSRDSPQGNPYRNLLSLTKSYPLLRHTLVAAAALHMSNVISKRLCPTREFRRLRPWELGESSRRAYEHALAAKHKALSLMRDAVQNLDAVSGDIVLAAVIFLINLELIESGKNGWRAHLDGAAKIVSFLNPACVPSARMMRELMLADFLTYYIVGSAFMSAPPIDLRLMARLGGFEVLLNSAAAHSYICSPAKILVILHEASQLSNRSLYPEHGDATAAGLALLRRAQEFDVDAWAADEHNFSKLRIPPLATRTHAGHAHRLAVCLYIIRSLPSLNAFEGHQEMADAIRADIVYHVSAIPDDDPDLKVVTWPSFVVGADALDTATRQWVLNKLRLLASSFAWGFLHTGLETLHRLWDMKSPEAAPRCWVKTLKDTERNFLII